MITRLQKRHTRIMICEANPLVAKKLARAGITDLLGVENIHANLASARVWLAFNHETIMDS